ncbi:GTPase IMAP family member 4-like isoform X3 [Parambassis ranga]|uniref:GTPase IMAP family member 4-like isoform X3 n=1 Tax=Parambassis ranga TaxID=210632 RepID=A0A6P7IAC7_9TELE|nr:GTPase IMAP family member 4-like isoform X3 [Parambassis ranga]
MQSQEDRDDAHSYKKPLLCTRLFFIMTESNGTRIVLLGKTGSGKSSLGNTLLGESLLKTKSSPNSETIECQAESKVVNGIHTTVVDTPGFFDTNTNEEALKPEVVKCIAECSPGPHAFLIVLRVDRYTEQEKAVIDKILQHFSEEVLKYAVVVFTYGDQLDREVKIEDFVHKNKDLRDLVKKCGGRCHVVDNKYWNNNNDDDYRNNQFQVTQLLNTIERMKQSGGFYTNEMLQKVEELKKKYKDKGDFVKRLMRIFAGVTAGALLGALFGVRLYPGHPVVCALAAALGGSIGYGAAEHSSTPGEAALKAVQEVGAVGQVFLQAEGALQGGESKDTK